jgi:hypothetical protein
MNKLLTIASLVVLGAAFQVGCGSDDNNSNPTDSGSGTDTAVTDTGTKPDTNGTDSPTDSPTDTPSDTPSTPTPPTLGTQIDRMGRPAINTALNHPFDTDSTAKGNAKDAYNQDKDPTNWVKPTVYVPQFMANLGVLDALDGKCGNQLAYKGTGTPPAPEADSYSVLAGVLAADMLWLKTDAATCTLDSSPNLPAGGYLAVEANALGFANTDCGGRALSYDVMNVSYGLLALGASGIGTQLDGITAVPARSTGKSFPYMAAPH